MKKLPPEGMMEEDLGEAIAQKIKSQSVAVDQYSITDALQELDRTIPETEQGQCSCLGISALTNPALNNAMRTTMFTSHINQFVAQIDAEPPFIFTTAENTAGKHSNSYKQVKCKKEVYRKIVKFDGLVEKPTVYVIFFYDEVNDEYTVETRKPCIDLTENFGYEVNNEFMDQLKEGDTVKEGDVLWKSESYDEAMNFGYGQNVTIMYTLDPFTSEDACVASQFLHEQMNSIEVETIDIKLNTNVFLLNLYGDREHYKVLPNIGENIKGQILAAARPLYNNQILYDFKKSNLSRTFSSDTKYYLNGNYEVVDMTIYNNNDKLVKNIFNEQINEYILAQDEYYSEIRQVCGEIMRSGSKYSRDIEYYYKRAGEMIDTKKKWKEKDSAFSNMMIRVQVRRIAGLEKGQKLSPRYGNKSVVAVIRPNDAMPYTADGRRVDLMFNLLAITNRTTAMPLYELLMTSICWKAREKMATLPTLEAKEALCFELVGDFNPSQKRKMYKTYSKLSHKEKENYIIDVIEEGLYLHEKPMFAEVALFKRTLRVMEKYDWIMSDTIYVNQWGRKIKCMRKAFIGDMYVMKLKQSDRRGYSSRNTGAVDILGLPTRRYKSRSHMEQTSSTAIRFGEYETLNFSIGLLPEDIAIFHALYRSSIKGRKDLFEATLTHKKLGPALDDVYISRAAEIYKVKMKALGIGVDFRSDDHEIHPLDDQKISMHLINKRHYLCTNYQAYIIKKEQELRQAVMDMNPCITTIELNTKLKEMLKNTFALNNIQYDEDGNLLIDSIGSLEDDED